jgi:hypothetical protein
MSSRDRCVQNLLQIGHRGRGELLWGNARRCSQGKGICLGRHAQRLLLVFARVVHVEVPVRFDRETLTSGSELGVFGQFIGNVGCFNPEPDADAR